MVLNPRDRERLSAAAASADAAGRLHPAQLALLHRRGWLRMLAPRSVGGAELALPDAVRLEEAVAELDGSAAWVLTLCAGAGWFAGFWPENLAREIIGTRRVCLAGSGTLTGHADREGPGWRITGQWEYASGAPWATHFTLNALLHEDGAPLLDAQGQPRYRSFVLPAAQVQVRPSWQSIGLRASATHRFAVDAQWVPEAQAFDIRPEAATAQGPLYRFPFLPLAYVTLAANLSGLARSFVALAGTLIRARRVAQSEALIEHWRAAGQALAAAREDFHRALDEAWDLLVERGELGEPDQLRLRAVSLALVRQARAAVDGLYPCCGLQAARVDAPINRVWRDFHTASQHSLLLA